MDSLVRDVRFGVRMLLKSPMFTLVAVLALAVGIGANTAIFTLVHAALIKPLPYAEPENLVMIWEHNRPRLRERNVISLANFLRWQEQTTSFEQIAAFWPSTSTLTGAGDPEEVSTQAGTVNFFSTLGVNPAIGRGFTPEDAKNFDPQAAVLSDGFWKRRFGADPGIVGRTITLDGKAVTIVGVMPADFQLFVRFDSFSSRPADLWFPIVLGEPQRKPRGRFAYTVGRLKPGVTLAQAQSEMDAISARLEIELPEFDKGWGIKLVGIQDELVGEVRPALYVLLAAVGLVLLIACANIANLLLARAMRRKSEIAIRSAIGASRWRVIQQLLVESLLLAVIGGVLGVLLARWGVDVLLALSPKEIRGLAQVRLNLQVLGFTSLVTALTGVFFGLMPALEVSKLRVIEILKRQTGGGIGSPHSRRFRSGLVVVQVALAVLLLIGSGLLVQSFLRLESVDPGFNQKGLLTAKIQIPMSRYAEADQRIAFYNQLVERVKALPGVKSASAISFLPFTGLVAGTGFTIESRPAPPAGQEWITEVELITPEYFKTMETPLAQGRMLTEAEGQKASNVVIINETMARQFFPNENPIGKRLLIEMSDPIIPTEIIGVVKDSKNKGLDRNPRPMAYWAYPQLAFPFMTLVIRADNDPLQLIGALQREVSDLDQNLPLADVQTMEMLLAESIARSRFAAFLLTLFAGIALLMSVVGVYAVVAYTTAEQTREIGIRVALGAESRDVLKLILGQGMGLVLAGIALGTAAAAGFSQVLSTLLYSTSENDPLTFAGVGILFAVIALTACVVPAVRAMRISPTIALRYE
ncbi:MAG TPA: ABC transporter permease [Acidobacteriota bacterium]|nr:ABC transporter permease [Acidobacteriota bacterium]